MCLRIRATDALRQRQTHVRLTHIPCFSCRIDSLSECFPSPLSFPSLVTFSHLQNIWSAHFDMKVIRSQGNSKHTLLPLVRDLHDTLYAMNELMPRTYKVWLLNSISPFTQLQYSGSKVTSSINKPVHKRGCHGQIKNEHSRSMHREAAMLTKRHTLGHLVTTLSYQEGTLITESRSTPSSMRQGNEYTKNSTNYKRERDWRRPKSDGWRKKVWQETQERIEQGTNGGIKAAVARMKWRGLDEQLIGRRNIPRVRVCVGYNVSAGVCQRRVGA